ELYGPLRELRAELCGRAVDDHAEDRVLRVDPGRDRRWLRLRLGRARLVAPAMLDDLGEDAHRDLFGCHRADVEPGRRPEPTAPLGRHATLLEAFEDHPGPPATRDQAHVAGVGPKHAVQDVLGGIRVRGDDHRTAPGSAPAPPTQPRTLPSSRINAFAPGFAEVGASQRTTVASANASPARWSAAASSSSSSATPARVLHSVTPFSRKSFHTLAGV